MKLALSLHRGWSTRILITSWFSLCLLFQGGAAVEAAPAAVPTVPVQTEHVILFVLEGFGQDSLKGGTMPALSRLIKDGSVTWSATAVKPALRLPTMASLITGLPVEKHGISWNVFEFSRGYPRAPSLFDYLDLSGGRDSAIFLMDESLYQLARPEPYTDYQMCGPLKPECSTDRIVSYIRQYFKKATSGHGYGHAIPALPHFLVVHLPEAGRVGTAKGWTSKEYREALRSVDKAINSVLDLYTEKGLTKGTTLFVTSLSAEGSDPGQDQADAAVPMVPWIASGVGIKHGYAIHQPVSILDTGATVMRTLGLQTHTEWESHAVEEIFQAAFVAAPRISLE
ncbi:MAG: alkaline phosphatase family protein [Nitrospirota bacterium]|nr:alkaline phosphatase family protein [Nitrospirota bacterium]MDP2381797.1 alkaline phosphatase family protein [Nitrospirota bacterium]